MSTDTAALEDFLPPPRKQGFGGFLRQVTNTRISIELLTDMRSSRTHWAARRVVLRASITSVIVLAVAFIVIYSVLLSYISNRVPMMRLDSSSEKSKSGKRTKFLARPFEVFGGQIVRRTEDTVVKWNIEQFLDMFVEKPQCRKGSKLIILITSSPENADRRKSIRETWCSPTNFNMSRNLWQCIFLIGHSSHQPSHPIIVEEEISAYGDILLGSYIDTYRNLTIKVIHGLHWASHECPNRYVLKTDDDVYVNVRLLVTLLDTYTPKQNVYIGLVVNSKDRLEVIRNPLNKWVVSMSEYSDSHYPPYAIGMGYLLSFDVVSRMVNLSQYVTVIPNEDAYIGVLADHLDVEPHRSGRFTLTGTGLRVCNLMYLIVIHHLSASEQYDMFQNNIQAPLECSPETQDYLMW